MTPADWERVKTALTSPYGRVRLKCDTYDLTLGVVPQGPLRYMIVPFLGGRFKGEWIVNDCEERRRFLRRRKVTLYSTAETAKLVRKFGRKRAEEIFHIERAYQRWYLEWPSFAPLKRHLIANNESIELVEV